MVSIKDVARIAGVSIATVSRTLSDPSVVSEATRQKVTAAIESSGYIANTLARNFRTRRSNTVLVLVPDIANSFFSQIIHGIESAAHDAGYRILLGDTQGNREREHNYASLADQKQVDGIVLLGASIPFDIDRRRRKPAADWPPMVIGCEYFHGFQLPTVRIDNQLAASDAVAHLIGLGHRRIAYINGPQDSPLCIDRLSGYKKALKQAGLRFDAALVAQGDYSLASGVNAMTRLLALPQPPSAVFAASDEMAIGAIRAAKAGKIAVPKQLSVVGFDDIAFAEFSDPPLTTIHQPRVEIGRRVMGMLLKLLREEPLSERERELVLPHELVVRESTVPFR